MGYRVLGLLASLASSASSPDAPLGPCLQTRVPRTFLLVLTVLARVTPEWIRKKVGFYSGVPRTSQACTRVHFHPVISAFGQFSVRNLRKKAQNMFIQTQVDPSWANKSFLFPGALYGKSPKAHRLRSGQYLSAAVST
ncbi:hypothetical protein L596_027514 [Steinernema carpocapsae]|uniref:Secreted protein n=1 Tax=Steinernema carpocapsae TaxID=34508 RepID=A0A4U5LVQ2_STECR|nr:hypothetical protein L596_027514 [Steinernema carpocapsae]